MIGYIIFEREIIGEFKRKWGINSEFIKEKDYDKTLKKLENYIEFNVEIPSWTNSDLLAECIMEDYFTVE